MWAAIDGRRYDVAKTHMREAQALAEMSGDQAIKFRIWSHTGTMYRRRGRPADAFAANDVARNLHITRRDPMFASLGMARQAAIHGAAHDRTGTRRAFDQAQDAMLRADPARPGNAHAAGVRGRAACHRTPQLHRAGLDHVGRSDERIRPPVRHRLHSHDLTRLPSARVPRAEPAPGGRCQGAGGTSAIQPVAVGVSTMCQKSA